MANFYLTYFDHWIKEELGVKHYFRYADDMVIIHDDKKYLHKLLVKIQEYLWKELKLIVKYNHRVFPVSTGIDFLGYVFRQGYTLLRPKIKKNFAKMIKYNPNPQSISSYLGWTSHADCRNLERKLLC